LIAVFFLLLGSAASARADSDSGVLNDWEAADRVDRNGWEPRWRNWDQNNRTPADWELHEFFATTKYWGSCGEWLKERITGNFTGTTDEIIQWGAYKWGIDPDIVRAVAVKESYWNQDGEGDWDDWGNSRAHGIIKIRDDVNPGTCPLSRQSTALPSITTVRRCASTITDALTGSAGGTVPGTSGALSGAWYSGGWWDSGAQWYVGEVQRVSWPRTWEGF
jgi:autotransporter family porin